MKREIKFRAWDGSRMYYFENHEWTLDFNDISGWNVVKNLPIEQLKGRAWDAGESSKTANDFELMQYTGLHDKNGKEIYEGDICRVLYTDWGSKSDNDPRTIDQYIHDISKVCIVEFIDYEWAFNFGPNRYGEIGYGSFHVGAHGFVELVGNIFQNPELIDFNITE